MSFAVSPACFIASLTGSIVFWIRSSTIFSNSRRVRTLLRCFGPEASAEMNGSVMRDSSETDSSRSEEHTSELQSRQYLVCRLLLEKKKEIRAQTLTAVSNGTRDRAAARR